MPEETPNTDIFHTVKIQKHFPNDHKYHKILNESNVKTSYSRMSNIKSIINMHYKEAITEKKKEPAECNKQNVKKNLITFFRTNAKL